MLIYCRFQVRVILSFPVWEITKWIRRWSFSDVNEGIYVGTGVTNVANDFTEGGDISEGANTFSGSTLGSNNYEGGIQDIAILPDRR